MCSSILSQNQAIGIVEELFPVTNETTSEPDASLDRLVVSMSADLIDDFPASGIILLLFVWFLKKFLNVLLLCVNNCRSKMVEDRSRG